MKALFEIVLHYSGEIIIGGIAVVIRQLEITFMRKKNRQFGEK
jgi:hypothetical protein